MNIRDTTIVRNKQVPFIELKEGAHPIYPVRKHSHEELSFGFVERNSSRIFCKALHFRLDINQVILLPPDTVHLCQPDDTDKYIFKILHIDPIWFFSAFNLDARSLIPQAAQLDKNAVKMKDRFFASFALIEDALIAESEILLFIGNLLFNVFDIDQPKPQRLEDETAISNIKTYLDQNFTEQIQLDDLAALYGKSKFSLLRKFKAVYKLTPHAYLLNKRINAAKQLLLKGESIAQTAVGCGFFDQSHFVKTFRQYVGLNPIDYK
jgi:AraC-like DNA-binding protein